MRKREREKQGGRETERVRETERKSERKMYNIIIEFILLLLTMAAFLFLKGMTVVWHLLVI